VWEPVTSNSPLVVSATTVPMPVEPSPQLTTAVKLLGLTAVAELPDLKVNRDWLLELGTTSMNVGFAPVVAAKFAGS
jgi:hypothetical protein